MKRKVVSRKIIYSESNNYQQIKVALWQLTLECGHVTTMPFHAPPVLKERNCTDCPRKPRKRKQT